MTIATTTSIASIILCLAVLVQSVRLMRALEAVKGGGLGQIVGSVEAATSEARRVLGRLTDLLRGDLAMTAQTLQQGKAMVDELTVMTGIANAIAERIVEAAGASNRDRVTAVALPPPPPSAAPAPPPTPERRAAAITAGKPAPRGRERAKPEAPAAPKAMPVRRDLPPGTIVAAAHGVARTSRRLRARIEADRALADAGADAGVAA